MNTQGRFHLCRFAAFLGALLASCGFANSACAQQATAAVPQFEVGGAYSYLRANGDNSNGAFNVNGGSASLAYNFTDRFSAIAEFDGSHFSGLPNGVSSTMYTYLFGPRYSFRKGARWSPFAHALLGVGRLDASSSGVDAGENGLAMAVGGGVDLHLRSRFSIRLIEADYLFTNFYSVAGTSETQNNLRVSTGIVFRFDNR